MNSGEILTGSRMAQQAVAQAILEGLKNAPEAQSATLIAFSEREAAHGEKIYPAGMLRVPFYKAPGHLCFGLNAQAGIEHWARRLEVPQEDPTSAPKNIWYFVAQALSPVFQKLRTEQGAGGSESVAPLIMHGAMLSGWNVLTGAHFPKVLDIELSIGSETFSLMVPLMGQKSVTALTEQTFGFKAGTRILVVDDSATSRRISRHHLEMAGYFNLDEAVDGQAAFSKVLGSRPSFDLVVADWHMPNLSGLELLKKIRGHADLKGIPVILATGERNKDEILQAIQAGVTGYLVKPLEPISFYRALKKAGSVAGGIAKVAP